VSGSADLAQAAIERKGFRAFADVMHHNAMMLHSLVMTCMPPVCYFAPESVKVLRYVLAATQSMDVCCTLDAGSNVVILCDPSCRDAVARDLRELGVVYLETGIGGGVEIIKEKPRIP
jgi:mevalonate pyrophosphate decarboxylase